MVTKIEIENFKCFKETFTFECNKLNLFTGINGRGKSSAMQILLLISQSVIKSNSLNYIHLRGSHINLGLYSDIKNSFSPRSKNIKIGLSFDDTPCFEILCNEDETSVYRANILNKEEFLTVLKDAGTYGKILETLKHVHFVSADRLGPQMFMEKVDLPEFINVGKRGEYTWEILAQSQKNNIVVNEAMYLGEESNSLLRQTIAWMSYIFNGARIAIKGDDSDSSVLSLLINNREDGYMYKPINIGFGYSYLLPLVVSGLLAKPGEILIVENPEAHLHPSAQSHMAEFYAKLAASGVQVFIESHSEHILNGVRLACVDNEIGISNTDTSVFFFGDDFSVKKIAISKVGKMESWPRGFFDQKEHDIAKLMQMTVKKI